MENQFREQRSETVVVHWSIQPKRVSRGKKEKKKTERESLKKKAE